jgi:hypothetical protein
MSPPLDLPAYAFVFVQANAAERVIGEPRSCTGLPRDERRRSMNPTETGIVLLALALTITTLGATVVGVAAAVLAGKAGHSLPEAVMVGARAFGGAMTVIFALEAVIMEAFKK